MAQGIRPQTLAERLFALSHVETRRFLHRELPLALAGQTTPAHGAQQFLGHFLFAIYGQSIQLRPIPSQFQHIPVLSI